LQKLTLREYGADDDPDAREEWNCVFAEGLRLGEMSFPHERIRGIERVPEVIEAVAQGRYVGAVLIELEPG
jgi:2-alkenal reductase